MVPYASVEQPYQFVQPVQPRMMRYTSQNGPSCKTVSDIESFMENRKMKDLPAFRPNPSGYFQGFSPIYCGSKEEWNFLHKAIVHRSELEEHIKSLDAQRDHKKTKMFVEGVVSIINPTLEQLSKNSNAQMSYLTKQGDALMKLFESKPSSDRPTVEVSPQDSIERQAQTLPVQSSQANLALLLQPLIDVASNEGLTKHLEDLFEDESPDEGPVTQPELDY